MIVLRIIAVVSFTDEPDEEVSVYTFVVMQWDQVQIVEPQDGGDDEDRDHAEHPHAFRNIVGAGSSGRLRRVLSLCRTGACASFLTG